MQKELTIVGTNIPYILDINKRKNTYIQIKDGKVIVKVPKNTTQKYIDTLLLEKLDWIEKKVKQSKESIHSLTYEYNSIIPLLGKNLVLNIKFVDTIKKVKIENTGKLLIINFPASFQILSNEELKLKVKKVIDNYYKSIAKEEVLPAMEYITNLVGLYPTEVHIKNLKATWGICSSKKHITINQNLMMFSRHAIEYVCLHEVCHLKYMNHSKEFWNMVAYYMPDYKEAKKELKE